MAVIYRITNMANGKYYIGSTESFARREWQHKYDLRRGVHKNPRLQAAWNKYGEEMFVFEVIEEIPTGGNQLQIEDMWLGQHVGRAECYNINPGAEAPRLGVVLTATARKNISDGRVGKHAGPDHYRYGKAVSPEVRAKISATQKGRPNPRKGEKMSEQGRLNVAAAVKRGKESHFYGKRPVSADALQKKVYVLKPDGTQETYPSLTYMRDTLGISIATTIRACKSGNMVQMGVASGWRMSYEPLITPDIPEEYAHLPRTRQLAKERGAAQYFTGIPCERGHVGPRAAKGTCIMCRREDDAAAYAKKKIDQTQNTVA
jgi:group I intron endonuclease